MFRQRGVFCFSIRLLEMFRQRDVEKWWKEMKNKTYHADGTFLII
jgi:hypothetical protein